MPLHSLFAFLVSETNGLADALRGLGSAEVAEAPFMLNPFGTAFTALTWGLLVSVNLWCFYKVFYGAGKGPRQTFD